MAETYQSLCKILTTARDPHIGKPTENNTRVRLLQGTKQNPELIGVYFHATDILKYHADGCIDLYTGHRSSPTTNMRISNYSRIHRYTQLLPTYNGRLPDPQKVYCVWSKEREEHVVCNSINGYIRYKRDGTIDLDTVRPQQIEIIDDSKALRSVMKKGKQVCDLIHGLQRLGFRYSKPSSMRFDHWLMAAIEVPLEQCVPAEAHTYGATFKDGLLQPEVELRTVQLRLGRERGYMKEINLKSFKR